MPFLQVGEVLYGYCGGYFGRDSYGEKRVEAVGYDWVVARDGDDPVFACCCHDDKGEPWHDELRRLSEEGKED